MSKAKALADLKRSGLGPADFKKMKLTVLTDDQNEKLTTHCVPGYKIPFLDLAGKPIKNAWRVRHLEVPTGPFGSKPDKEIRYTGPKDELPHLYFPPNFKGWKQVAKDVTEPVFITEGEKKAACMCKNGYPTIAVPGVWGWRSAKQGVDLLAEFKFIDWGDKENQRPVVLVFDNDVATKPQVFAALTALANKMTDHYADVYIKYLPDGPAKGADDYLLAHGTDKFNDLPDEPFARSAALWRFQERVTHIKKGNFFIDVEDLEPYKTTAMLKQAYGNEYFTVVVDEKLKKLSVVEEWIKFEKRRQHKDMVFRPDKPIIIDDCVNTWRGWGCEPKEGSIKPFTDLVDLLFKDEPMHKDWFWCWLAKPLQDPGVKMNSSVLLWSVANGVGKTALGECVRRIYGQHSSRIEKEHVISDWNSWLINKQFILGEEMTGDRSRSVADKVKSLITRETAMSNEKYEKAYEVDDLANYFLTSNHPDSLFLKSDDRRFFVMNCENKGPQSFYDKFFNWRDKHDGPARLFHHLLHKVDCSKFNPYQPPPMTNAKEDMIDSVKSTLQLRTEELFANPDKYLKLNRGQKVFAGAQRDVFTSHELLQLMDLANTGHDNERALSKMLVEDFYAPKKRTAKRRLVAIRNLSHWRRATTREWVDNYEADFAIGKMIETEITKQRKGKK